MRVYLRGRSMSLVLVVSVCLIGLACQSVWAQEALSAKLLPYGGVRIMAGDELLATLSLNAHGPEWKHADQNMAMAMLTDADPGPGKIAEGILPVLNTNGGAIRFLETLQPTARGFGINYELGFTKTMGLNGLQVSLLLPAKTFRGKSVVLQGWTPAPAGEGEGAAAAAVDEDRPAEKASSVLLPAELDGEKWQLATVFARKIQIAAGTAQAITITPKLPDVAVGEAAELPQFVVQDLRRWDQDTFEVRLVLIMNDQPQEVADDEVITVGLDLTFAGALQWE